MNNPPLILEDGKQYVIDKDFANGGIITLIEHRKYFCTVEDPETGSQWETMTYRLSAVDNEPLTTHREER